MNNFKQELKKKHLPDKKKRKKKSSEDSGERFWKEMMGVNRPTYERRKGAVRQK